MQRTKPPFRADQVGSLLRSAALKDARARRASGEISADQLKTIEDREIELLIKKQEKVEPKSAPKPAPPMPPPVPPCSNAA